MLKLFSGLWNAKFVGFTKLLKKEKYFPLVIFDKRKNRSNITYLPMNSRLKSLRSMFLVTFLTVYRSGAIWFKWYLTFFTTVRTRNRMHLSWSAIKTLASVKITWFHHIIPPHYNILLLLKYLQKAVGNIWTRLWDSFMENSSNYPSSHFGHSRFDFIFYPHDKGHVHGVL